MRRQPTRSTRTYTLLPYTRLFLFPEIKEVGWRVLKPAKRGTRVVDVPGNHDGMVKPFDGFNFGGVEILREAVHETADGKKLLIVHGDEFDAVMLAHRWLAFVGDAAYTALMKANVVVNAIRNRLGLPYWSLRSEEHTSELQSLMRISYAVFCLKKKNTHRSTSL